MNEPEKINEILLRDFDPRLIEDKQGKRYIGHEHIRMRVIEATGNQFEWHVASIEYRDDGVAMRGPKDDKYAALVMIVTGTLTIPGLGSRSGTGVQVLEGNMGEDGYKMAESDAFKRAAMAFGVGLRQLYMGQSGQTQQQPARATTSRAKPQKVANERDEMSDAQFDEEVRKALASKDSQRFMALADEAGKYTSRWLVLIRNCESPQSLDWVARQIERKGHGSDLITHEIEKRRAEIESGREAF